MAATDFRDSFVDLERHRRRLEETISQLRKDLRHWQKWETEYEGVKEELQALPSNPSKDDMLQAGKAFESGVVDEKEVKDLIGYEKDSSRTLQQVCDLISRRIEVAQRNVEQLQKTLDSTELKLASASIVSQPDEHNEEGLPMTEILEELDEEGNVISGTTSHHGDAAPQMVEALKKAGIKEEDVIGAPLSQKAETSSVDSVPNDQETKTNLKKQKSVSFTKDTKSGGPPKRELPKFQPPSGDQAVQSQNLADLVKGSFSSGDRVIELDEYDDPVDSTGPALTINESAKDAALRRQMLQYNLGEMNNIVAQLDLEEVGSDEDDDEELELGSLSSGSDIEGEEDDHGMATGSQLSAHYRKEMLELEKILNMRMMENIGQAADGSPIHGPKSPTSPKKDSHVHFSDHLDIAPTLHRTHSTNSVLENSTSTPSTAPEVQDDGTAPTMAEIVIERKAPSSSPQPTGSTLPAKRSRFKQSRAQASTVPEQSAQKSDRELLSDVAEHAPSQLSSIPPPAAPDEYDVEQHVEEIREEYHRQRSKFHASSSSSSGHKYSRDLNTEDDDDDDAELIEDSSNAATKKRISLFKASRLRHSSDA